MPNQHGPHHGIETLADHRFGRHVDENGAEQRQRDADTAEDEIFPRRFECLMGTIDADHQYGGEGRDLDRDPHQSDVVGHQREVHGEHQHLVHGVVEAYVAQFQSSDLDLMADIARAECTGGEADKGRQHDENLVEVVHQQIRAGCRLDDEQR